MDFPHNYELRIMNYEFIMTRTSVRLYEGWIHQQFGFSQQLRITHYELWIMNYELWIMNFPATTMDRPYVFIRSFIFISPFGKVRREDANLS